MEVRICEQRGDANAAVWRESPDAGGGLLDELRSRV